MTIHQPIVFVGGVHGSGKTTISRLLAALLPAAHVTAGALIRETAAPTHVVTVGTQDKAVPNVDANQALLLRGLEAYRARIGPGTQPLLLDGHFCLLDPNGSVVDVPLEVFKAIEPVAVLLVEADHRTVHNRLAERAAAAPSPEVIAALAERERARAIQTSTALQVPMWTVAGDSVPEESAQTAASQMRSLLKGVA